MATLFKRSGAPLYRVFVGADWGLFAQNLSQEQCFEVQAVLHAPLAIPEALETVTAAICCLGTPPKRNGWFEASLEQAMRILAATLPPASDDERCTQQCSCEAGADEPAPKRRRGQKDAFPAPEGVQTAPEDKQCQEAAPIPSAETAVPAEEDDACTSVPDTPKSYVMEGDAVSEECVESDPLWGYVSACTTRDAAKATDLRAALEAQCGKKVAKSLLGRTKATVAQDASGKKN